MLRVAWTVCRQQEDGSRESVVSVGSIVSSHHTPYGAELVVATDDGRLHEVMVADCRVAMEMEPRGRPG